MTDGGKKTITPHWRTDHSALISIINGEFPAIWMRILNEFWPKRAFNIAAKNFGVRNYLIQDPFAAEHGSNVMLPASQTKCASVSFMKSELKGLMDDDLVSVILHGSLGNNEVVNYSDFDALVIIKNEVFGNTNKLARVAHVLFQVRRIMYQQDPLQHHGWFVLPEQALNDWPEDYLPMIVLENSSQICDLGQQELSITSNTDYTGSSKHFENLIAAIRRDIASKAYLYNYYQFKSLISKVLLLPAMYVQVRDGRGIFKKESFDMARNDFVEDEWSAIDVASRIRLEWPKVLPTFPEFLSTRPGWIGNLWRRKKKQPISVHLLDMFRDSEVQALMRLMDKMQEYNMKPAK